MWTLTRVFREIYLHLIVQETLGKWRYRSLWGTPGGLNLHKLVYSIWVFENRCHRGPHCQCKKCRQCFQPIGELTTKVRKRKEGSIWNSQNRSEIKKINRCQMPRKYSKAHELFNRKKCVQNDFSSPWHYKVRQQCLRLLVKAQRKKYSLFCLGTLHEFLKWAKFPSHFRFRRPKNESAESLWLQYKY